MPYKFIPNSSLYIRTDLSFVTSKRPPEPSKFIFKKVVILLQNFYPYQTSRSHGIVDRILDCHPVGLGSNPRRGNCLFFLIEDKKWLSLFNKTVLYNSKILGDIIEFCNNKFFKSGDVLSTGAIIQYANQYVYSGQSWV